MEGFELQRDSFEKSIIAKVSVGAEVKTMFVIPYHVALRKRVFARVTKANQAYAYRRLCLPRPRRGEGPCKAHASPRQVP